MLRRTQQLLEPSSCAALIWRQGMDGCPVPPSVLAEQAHQLLLLANAGARRDERLHGTSGSPWHAATTIVATASRAEHCGHGLSFTSLRR